MAASADNDVTVNTFVNKLPVRQITFAEANKTAASIYATNIVNSIGQSGHVPSNNLELVGPNSSQTLKNSVFRN